MDLVVNEIILVDQDIYFPEKKNLFFEDRNFSTRDTTLYTVTMRL